MRSMRRIGILGAALGSVVAMTTVGGAAQAHPPDNPYDNTIFAPVRTGGVGIGLDSVTRGLTAPVKAVAVPGHRHRLFVTDQVGRLSSLELTSGRATVVLDVTARLVPLGIGGPGTFDERGFLATAPHPAGSLRHRCARAAWALTEDAWNGQNTGRLAPRDPDLRRSERRGPAKRRSDRCRPVRF